MRIMPASYWLYVNNIKAMKWIKIISKQKFWVRNWDDIFNYWAAKQQISWFIAPWWIFIPFLWPSGSLLLPVPSSRLERHLHFALIKLCQASWMWYRFSRLMSLSLLFSSSIKYIKPIKNNLLLQMGMKTMVMTKSPKEWKPCWKTYQNYGMIASIPLSIIWIPILLLLAGNKILVIFMEGQYIYA